MGKISEFIIWRLVSSELRIQSFATPTIICAVFLQFDFSEGQKDDILYCIYYICKFSLQNGFTDYLQNDSCDWRLWRINYIHVVLPNEQWKLCHTNYICMISL